MAEIKLNDDFMTELAEFKASADELNRDEYSKARVSEELSLPVVDAYRERITKLWEQVFRFKLLVEKDAADIKALTERLQTVDTSC